MGPAHTKPKNYDPSKMHDAGVWGGYMAAYKGGNTQTLGKKVSGRYQDYMPVGSGTVAVGAKILQSRTNELYVIDRRGNPITLTKNGVPKPNASQLLRSDPNWGKGPTVGFLGNPANPKIVMWTANDMSTSKKFTPTVINSYSDFYHVMSNNVEVDNQLLNSDYGQAATDPFIDHPRDVWSAVGDENAAIGKIGSQLIVPAAESFLDDVIPGASLVLDATGVSGKLTNWLDSAINQKGKAYTSAPQYQKNLSNVLHDPRLDMTLQGAEHSAGLWSKQSNDKQLQLAMGMPDSTGEQKVAKLQQLRDNTVRLYASSQSEKLIKTAETLKNMVGAHTGFDFSQIQSGLAAAGTPQQKLNIISYFSKQIKTELLPLIQTQSNSADNAPSTSTSQPTSAPPTSQSSQVQGQPRSINGDTPPQRDQHGNTV